MAASPLRLRLELRSSHLVQAMLVCWAPARTHLAPEPAKARLSVSAAVLPTSVSHWGDQVALGLLALALRPSSLAGFHWAAGLCLKPPCSVCLWARWSPAGCSLGLPDACPRVLSRPPGNRVLPCRVQWPQLSSPALCRLNSTEYGELCEKIRAPIRRAANVVICQSLGDLFLETFASLVEVNPAYTVPSSQVGVWVVGWRVGSYCWPPMGQVPGVQQGTSWGCPVVSCDLLGLPAGTGGMHWLHADASQCEAGEDMPGGSRGRVPAVLLPPHVVSHLHGQVVCQPPGPAAP